MQVSVENTASVHEPDIALVDRIVRVQMIPLSVRHGAEKAGASVSRRRFSFARSRFVKSVCHLRFQLRAVANRTKVIHLSHRYCFSFDSFLLVNVKQYY